ncbi:BREX system P-loop protein BrxC [Ligilactobacillus ceti]|uniref:BREX system P-loop protein BrxC n=1 Tax=Ligilactobacillus ceti DSM 22408 TaxID=1122146 RepID=A0A0R2KMA5_9LACO|nr:BREX system P-loop protein BrxC [Ligilactobacillus ceti]KRN88806.1 hypothetical protein IV53_GL000776 [Ligilactobacillus ceti DSM 22408]
MKIQNMFYDDINRKINGVIKVDQDTLDVTKQEVDEYVITRELKKHFITFFNSYSDSFKQETDDIGVWISGFFGSGKSHFLKILSYILENKEIDGKTTVERFRNKLEDDPETFMLIDQCTKTPAETILFNIDIEGPMNKDKTAVMQVFAKMFYNHLGYYGDNFKVAKLEQYIDKKGKLDEFRRVFEEKNGSSWVDSRDSFDFLEDEVVETLVEVVGMSETAARNWFDSEEEINLSIANLVKEMKDYVKDKPKDYRLLFMIDEVGQYVGGDTDMLLNLQSLAEKIGSECGGKIWIMCTGQEAIDEIIRTRTDEFSRIQARFKTRLSLSSSSADEVIQKRILRKNNESKLFLENTYENRRNEMANLFKFRESVGDIRGFESAEEFSVNFPFVPYQFILMQKVFSEIRKHGNAGKHLSGGERSMLSGFQEATQRIQDKDENAIVPFYMFYDTVHTFLDSSIRQVVERCERAIQDNKGLEPGDENVLKLLYMIRYVDDVPAKLDNIIILMADDIRVDKINERTKIQESLDRLIKQNYIARTGDTYNFLTNEEQDVEREIKNEYVEPSEVSRDIAEIIFGQIYNAKKYRYNNKYDFDFDKKVDDSYIGKHSDNMEIQILTQATSQIDKYELKLIAASNKKVICVLAETEYYNYLEEAKKIKKYARKKNVSQLPKTMQDIIRTKQELAETYEQDAKEQLIEAFKQAIFYIDGENANITSGTPKEKIDMAFSNLVGDIYRDLNMIEENADSDEDILNLLSGKNDDGTMKGFEPNRKAANEVETFIDFQHNQQLPTTMADVQKRFQAIPYGWKEIDVAYVVARLIYEQKVTIKYGGETIRADNKRLPDLLRKKTEIGKTRIQKRKAIASKDIKEVKEFLRDFFGAMTLPQDDDGLSIYIVDKFEELQSHYNNLLQKYQTRTYPDKNKIHEADSTISALLKAKTDNIALVKKLIDMQDDLYDMQDDMDKVESFFDSQVNTFNAAVKLEADLKHDREYLVEETEVNEALNQIRLIVLINPSKDNYNYTDITKLNNLMKIVHDGHDKLLDAKKEDLFEIVRACMEEIHSADTDTLDTNIKAVIKRSDDFYTNRKESITNATSLAILESYIPGLWTQKDKFTKHITDLTKSNQHEKDLLEKKRTAQENKAVKEEVKEPVKVKHIKSLHRQILFPAKRIESEEEARAYAKEIEQKLLISIRDCDGIDIS